VNIDLKKRIITSIILMLILIVMFINNYILLYCLIIMSIFTWLEAAALITKICYTKIMRIFFLLLSLSYISLFSFISFALISSMGTKLLMMFTLLICVCSDIGGLTFGKIFKGKKLTKLSPNKTISGSVGSFIFSLFFMLIFILLNLIELNFTITLYVLATSMFCQIGDIFISYMKRKANVKDTGNILPGHGGLLDRVDGILFAVPLSIFVFYLLSI